MRGLRQPSMRVILDKPVPFRIPEGVDLADTPGGILQRIHAKKDGTLWRRHGLIRSIVGKSSKNVSGNRWMQLRPLSYSGHRKTEGIKLSIDTSVGKLYAKGVPIFAPA